MASLSSREATKDDTARRASWPTKSQVQSLQNPVRTQGLKRPLEEEPEISTSDGYPIAVIRQIQEEIERIISDTHNSRSASTCTYINTSSHSPNACHNCTDSQFFKTQDLWKFLNNEKTENYSLVVSFYTVCRIWCEARMAAELSPREMVSGILAKYSIIKLDNSVLDDSRCEGWDWFYNKIKFQNSCQISYDTVFKHFVHLVRTNEELLNMNWIDNIYTQLFHQTNSSLKFFEGESQIQRDRGQFFTPIEVVDFMWNIAIPNWDDHIKHQIMGARIQDLVFDPCMGLGTSILYYIDRVVKQLRSNHCKVIWNNPKSLELIYNKLRSGIFGIELDLVPFLVCLCRIEAHLFPIYIQISRLNRDLIEINNSPVRLFWNDTLQLLPREEFIKRPTDTMYRRWSEAQINKLRNFKYSFSIVLTNPPYLLRHQFSFPDPKLYSQAILGGKGHQAYLYFIWLGLHCISHEYGQLVMITPSQWLTCEFAQRFRDWMWGRIWMHRLFLFDPFKVFRKVQTNSLIFTLSWRDKDTQQKEHQIGFFKCKDKKLSLKSMLEHYYYWNCQLNNNCGMDQVLDPNSSCSIQLKLTTQLETKLTESPANPFYSLIPHNNLSHLMHQLAANLPTLCDSNGKTVEWDSSSPLIWNRGPNTNPVYGLVVRTEWAKQNFGEMIYSKYMVPCFYWNGCSNNPLRDDGVSGEGTKEIQFWNKRDPMRLSRKESSPAESYVVHQQYFKHYSLIMVDKLVAKDIIQKNNHAQYKVINPSISIFYQFLKEVREELQPQYADREIAYSNIQKCGNNMGQKIVTPINYGYFTTTQPRQRFFLEEEGTSVTNQCIYFTIKQTDQYDKPILDADYYLALLNSAIIQYYMNIHCQYDQQGRLRLFRSNMAHIPFQYPESSAYMQILQLSRLMKSLKSVVYSLQTIFNPSVTGPSFLLEPLRRGLIDLSEPNRWQIIEDCCNEIAKRNNINSFEWVQSRLRFVYRMVNFVQLKIDLLMFEIYQLPFEFVEELFQELDLMTQYENYLQEVDAINIKGGYNSWVNEVEVVLTEFDVWIKSIY
jgi:hypothetical protein